MTKCVFSFFLLSLVSAVSCQEEEAKQGAATSNQYVTACEAVSDNENDGYDWNSILLEDTTFYMTTLIYNDVNCDNRRSKIIFKGDYERTNSVITFYTKECSLLDEDGKVRECSGFEEQTVDAEIIENRTIRVISPDGEVTDFKMDI